MAGDRAAGADAGRTGGGGWVRALEKPLPTLAQKLGVTAAARAWVIGAPAPAEAGGGGSGRPGGRAGGAALIVAVLAGPRT